MKRRNLVGLGIAVLGLLARNAVYAAEPQNELQIYFIDVEGGQSTLVVTPEREALLIDTGFAGDGAQNVVAQPRFDLHLSPGRVCVR